ncbi:XRE family transcriptional regulator [Paenibacillus sp. LMG 31461]|uniref:XRE family transcriptional regulator n=1 Tax=Paenibacillus plantarum TaxID=2654975 RepID=A0ABX1X419_9BACL|nr:helix-turn-helix transcriptional regulator [Paenibacillus plantarum]NOU63153.1 XRE family transcriptional regulator [Paenibacillus plantarum]
MSIGEAIGSYKKSRNMTLEELSVELSIDPSTLSKVVRGKRQLPPSYDQVISSKLDWKTTLELIDVRTDGFISNILRHVPNLDLHPAALKDLLQKEIFELTEALEGLVTAKHIDPEKRREGAERVWYEITDVIDKAMVMKGVLEEEFGLDRKRLIQKHQLEVKRGER